MGPPPQAGRPSAQISLRRSARLRERSRRYSFTLQIGQILNSLTDFDAYRCKRAPAKRDVHIVWAGPDAFGEVEVEFPSLAEDVGAEAIDGADIMAVHGSVELVGVGDFEHRHLDRAGEDAVPEQQVDAV